MDVKYFILKNRSGTALVIALVMMVVLTLIGLSSILTSTFEMRISGNKRGSTDAFYTADAGIQSALITLTNFNVPGSFTAVVPADLPVNLQNELIDLRLSAPSLTLPAGVSFTDSPQVTLYHTTTAGAPKGFGFSATGGVEYQYYIVDSIGRDQIDSSLVRSTCQVREKVVRLLPVQ